VVETTPGYYYERIGGPVYSEKFGPKELKQIRNRIRSAFYDVPQLLRIAKKARRIGLVNGRDVAGMLLKLPFLLYSLVKTRAQKKRRKRHINRVPSPARAEQPKVTV